jgi:predicted phosphodiesterase
LNRRQFLKRAALAGAAIALAPEMHAGLFSKSRDPHTVALFSDVHIAADVSKINLGANMADQFTACVHELAHRHTKPAAVIVNGDLAFQTAQPADYAQFGRLLTPLRALAPIHLSLGNHDGREHFWNAFPADATAASATLRRQATVFATADANWFLLDSLIATNSTPGEVGPTQLDWLTRELDARPARPAIVVIHHHPQFFDTVPGLQDTGALMAALTPRRQVKLLVFGHTHDWRVQTHASGIHLINLPPTAYVFKNGRPSGWVRATLNPAGAEFELRSLDRHHPEHAQVKLVQWRLG